MSTRRKLAGAATLAALVMGAAFMLHGPDRPGEGDGRCLTLELPLMMDTSDNGAATYENPRSIGLRQMQWGAYRFLIENDGNRPCRFNITNPANPGGQSCAFWFLGADGDRDQNMMGYTVCDDCRYGFVDGSVDSMTWDWGDRDQPYFGASNRITDGSYAGYTYREGDHQYLINSRLPGGCASGSTIWRVDDIDTLINVGCLSWIRPLGGGRVGAAHYVASAGDRVHILTMSGSTVTDHGLAPFMAGAEGGVAQGHGWSVDGDLLATARNGFVGLYDVSDPLTPTLVHEWRPDTAARSNTVALRNGLLWISEPGMGVAWLYDVSIPSAPVLVERPTATYPHSDNRDVMFDPSGQWIWLARYSTLERHAVDGECLCGEEIFQNGFESGDTSAWISALVRVMGAPPLPRSAESRSRPDNR